jgi:uncharacterized cupredoxin-like copper-binding protein
MRLLLPLVAALMVVGCSGVESDAGGGSSLRISEKDFKISAPTHASAGDVRLSVRNTGPVAHELILVKLGDSALPLRADGLTVDEEAVEDRTAATIEPQVAGKQTDLDAHLTPGRYELLCNMAGHYLGGMHTELVVS